MTGHYKKKFNVKFDLDLGVKIVSFSKKLFLLSLLVSIARPGFSLFSERGLELSLSRANGYWKALPVNTSRRRSEISL